MHTYNRDQLTDKIVSLEGVKEKSMNALNERKPTDFSASVSIPYRHGAGGHEDCQHIAARVLDREKKHN